MKSNKFWITSTLVLLGICVYIGNKLYTVDNLAALEIEKCQMAMYGVAREGLQLGCETGIRTVCRDYFDCTGKNVSELYGVCYNMGAE